MSTQLCNPVETQILVLGNNPNSSHIVAQSRPIIRGIASKKDETGKLGNVKLADAESRKASRESVESSVSIVSPPKEPLSSVNLKLPIEVDSLEPTIEELVDFTKIPTGGKIETPDESIWQYKVADVGSQKVEKEHVDSKISIVSFPEEPFSLVNSKVPMEVYS